MEVTAHLKKGKGWHRCWKGKVFIMTPHTAATINSSYSADFNQSYNKHWTDFNFMEATCFTRDWTGW